VDEEYIDKSIIIKDYTPKQFYEEFVGLDLDEYLDIFNDSTHPVGRRYQVVLTRNLYDGHDLDYANVDIETLKEAAIKSLIDGTPLWFSVDVGVDQDRNKGIMLENLYDYGSPNHAMNLIGVDIQEGRPVKWLVENSWGSEKGSKGRWVMYDNWFDMNVYGIIVKKQYLPEEVVDIFEQAPIKLPVWDPMWQRR
jgi:bleomycin hydrolase